MKDTWKLSKDTEIKWLTFKYPWIKEKVKGEIRKYFEIILKMWNKKYFYLSNKINKLVNCKVGKEFWTRISKKNLGEIPQNMKILSTTVSHQINQIKARVTLYTP